MTRKSAELAAVLSFFFPGLGQVYNGEFVKAFLFILGVMLSGSMFGLYLTAPLWIWSVVDAYSSVEEINCLHRLREAVGKNKGRTTTAA